MSKPESPIRISASKTLPSKEGTSSNRGTGNKFRIVVTAVGYRDRDTDNLCAKVWIDCLRGKVIPDDSSCFVAETILRVKKIKKPEPEHTIIEVYEIYRKEGGD